jgi:hypothetical protein
MINDASGTKHRPNVVRIEHEVGDLRSNEGHSLVEVVPIKDIKKGEQLLMLGQVYLEAGHADDPTIDLKGDDEQQRKKKSYWRAQRRRVLGANFCMEVREVENDGAEAEDDGSEVEDEEESESESEDSDSEESGSGSDDDDADDSDVENDPGSEVANDAGPVTDVVPEWLDPDTISLSLIGNSPLSPIPYHDIHTGTLM